MISRVLRVRRYKPKVMVACNPLKIDLFSQKKKRKRALEMLKRKIEGRLK